MIAVFCASCAKSLGFLEKGTRLLKGVKHLCKDCQFMIPGGPKTPTNPFEEIFKTFNKK